MLNRYPLWKNITLVVVIIVSLIYALPNLYGEDPAIQITGMHGMTANEQTISRIKNILRQHSIHTKTVVLENGVILVRFYNTDIQLHASEVLANRLGEDYVVALNLAPATPYWLRILSADPMKLGLDLRGGVHFLIEVDVKNLLSKLLDQNINSLYNDLRKKDIPFVNMNKVDHYGLEVLFYDSNHRDVAINYLKPLHRNLSISIIGKYKLRATILDESLSKARENAVQQNINILRNRINQLGITELLIQRQGFNRIIVELPGIQDTARAKEILGATATLEFHLVNTSVNPMTITKGHIPDDSVIKQTSKGQMVVLYKNVILTGDHIIDSMSSMDEYNQPQVNIELDSIGGDIMSNFTKENIGRQMATLFVEYKQSSKKDANGHMILVKREELINVANIQSRFSNNFRIMGINNQNEARQLSLLLRAGALVTPIQIIEERIIGPTMGQQNIEQGIKACLWGLITAIIFMVVFYKKFGIIATNALVCNLVLIVSIMSILPGTILTMPGIAGIVLTLAVAVDANVLINERIKEELRNGRPVQQAIHEGYKGAFSSILDANLTTLIKVMILYIVGTSSIKGFAITTAIGIITSMLTSIIGTRAIVNAIYGGKRIDKLSI